MTGTPAARPDARPAGSLSSRAVGALVVVLGEVVRLEGSLAGPGAAVRMASAPGDVAALVRDARPDALLLAGPGGPAGGVRRRWAGDHPLEEAGEGPVDGAVAACAAAGILPYRTVVFEAGPGGGAALEDGLRRELRRLPLMALADSLRSLAAEVRRWLAHEGEAPSPAFATFCALLTELAVVEREGGWGRAAQLRDRFRQQVEAGEVGVELDQLDHMEWSQVWALMEELDRLERAERGG